MAGVALGLLFLIDNAAFLEHVAALRTALVVAAAMASGATMVLVGAYIAPEERGRVALVLLVLVAIGVGYQLVAAYHKKTSNIALAFVATLVGAAIAFAIVSRVAAQRAAGPCDPGTT